MSGDENLITKAKFQKMLPEGWTIKLFPVKKHDDSTWFYDANGVIVVIDKGDHRLSVLPAGDIDVSHEKYGSFYTGHGGGRGRLTQNLIKHGEWRMNNWLDIEYIDLKRHQELAAEHPTETPCFDDFGRGYDDVFYYVSEACDYLAECARNIDNGKHPFYPEHKFPIDFASEPVC